MPLTQSRHVSVINVPESAPLTSSGKRGFFSAATPFSRALLFIMGEVVETLHQRYAARCVQNRR